MKDMEIARGLLVRAHYALKMNQLGGGGDSEETLLMSEISSFLTCMSEREDRLDVLSRLTENDLRLLRIEMSSLDSEEAAVVGSVDAINKLQ